MIASTLRRIRRRPAIFTAIVVCVSLGTGANAALLALIHGLLVSPLPGVRQPQRLVAAAWQHVRGAARHPLSERELDRLTSATDDLLRWAGFSWTDLPLRTGEGPPSSVRAMVVTPGYFDVLGVEPALGRLQWEHEAGVVVSHRFWQRHLGGGKDVLGSSLHLAGRSVPVVGVAPAGFGGTVIFDPATLWIPLDLLRQIETPAAPRFSDASTRWLQAVGRLAPGVDPSVAQQAAGALGQRLAAAGERSGEELGLVIRPAVEAAFGSRGHRLAQRAAIVLQLTAGLVLLIACFDVVYLLLVKQREERGELVLRSALGAPQGVLLRQGFADTAFPVLIGSGMGAVAGPLALHGLWRWIQPPFLPEPPVPALPEPAVCAASAAIAVCVLAVVSVVPILTNLRADPARLLRDDKPTATASRTRRKFTSLLLGSQLALSVVAVTIAVLFLRSLGQSDEADLGFRTAGLGSVAIRSAESTGRLDLDGLASRVAEIAGVADVAVAGRLPLSLSSVEVAGLDPADGSGSAPFTALVERVGAGYFTVLDLPILAGRGFGLEARAEQPVGVVNAALAERMWPGESPIGRWIRSTDLERPVEVVGLVANSKLVTMWERPRPSLYLPTARDELSAGVLIFRVTRPPETVLPEARLALSNAAPNLLVGEAVDMQQTIEDSLWAPRLAAGLFSAFGGLSLVLVLTGLYGTAAFSAHQRTSEMAIHQAVGASPFKVVQRLARSGLVVTTLGVLVGSFAGLGISRLVGSLLIGIRPHDPVSFLAVAVLLFAASFLLHLLPIRRVLSVPIARVLRES